MVEAMRGNHQCASYHRDCHFIAVRRQLVSEPRRTRDTSQPKTHQNQDPSAPVPSKADQKRNGPKERYKHCKAAMDSFLCGQKVGQHR